MLKSFVHTVTLYNKLENRSTGLTVISWKRTVLKNCYFGTVLAHTLSDTSLSEQNSFVCRILEDPRFTEDYTGEENSFTLRPGDIIIRGDISDEISDEKGKRPADLLKKYCGRGFMIKAVSINTSLQNGKHYRVSGV